MKVFEEASRERFISDLAAEFPRRAATLGADGVRAWIQHGLERADVRVVGAQQLGRLCGDVA